MDRGMFGSLLDNELYTKSEKEWIVELQNVDMFWYELLMQPNNEVNTKQYIKYWLEDRKNQVNQCLEKRFIYFICSRKKVRFCKNKKTRYGLFDKNLHLYIEVGKDRARKKIVVPVFSLDGKNKVQPKVELDEKYITFFYSDKIKLVMPVHDFLLNTGLDLGISTEVHYVGYTKNPEKRPTNGQHAGLNDVLYRVSGDDDILIYFNIFKVISNAFNDEYNSNFIIANAMLDEIKSNDEGQIIEKCFINYFDAENQFRNKRAEKAELKNRLRKLAKDNGINSIQIFYELESPNEYFTFYSSKIKPKLKHEFTVKLNGNNLEVVSGSEQNT